MSPIAARTGDRFSPTASRPLRHWQGIALPLLIMALLLAEPSRLDFALADLLYQPGEGFVGRHSVFLEDWLHERAKQLVIGFSLLLLAGFLLSLLPTRLRPLRQPLGYVVLAMGLSTAIITPLKAATQVPCPWSLVQYGGAEHYSPLLGPRAEPVKNAGRCWPGGHAATGFSLFALFFVWRDRQPRRARAALLAALLLGSVLSIGRMLQGAHFLSHNLWTALLDWLICYGLYWLMLYRPPRLERPHPETLVVGRQVPSPGVQTVNKDMT